MRGVEIWVKGGVVLQDFNWPLRCLPLTFERGEVWIIVFQPKTIEHLNEEKSGLLCFNPKRLIW